MSHTLRCIALTPLAEYCTVAECWYFMVTLDLMRPGYLVVSLDCVTVVWTASILTYSGFVKMT